MSFQPNVWNNLVSTLAERGQGSRESGAFLLGKQDGVHVDVLDFVPYDDLEPDCLSTGIVRFSGDGYPELWAICRSRQMGVVGDVHTHPGSPRQSESDKTHPMMPHSGHRAVIIPNLAAGTPGPTDVSFNVYLGSHKWNHWEQGKAQRVLYVGRFM